MSRDLSHDFGKRCCVHLDAGGHTAEYTYYTSSPLLWLHSSLVIKYKVEVFRGGRSQEMPKHVKARAAQDEQEERMVRKLANSDHAPADWKWLAQMVLLSWVGKVPNEISAELDCLRNVAHPPDAHHCRGVAGLALRPGSVRKPRLTEQERCLGTCRCKPMGRW